MKLFNFLIHSVLPGKCMFCDKYMRFEIKAPYCTRCREELPFKEEKRCLLCSRQIDGEGNIKLCKICSANKMYFDANYSPFNYEGSVEDAIKRFKFADRSWYGGHFAKFIGDELMKERIKADYIVYPPVNRKTYIERGYNQSEILAKKLSKILGIPVVKNAIRKTRDNPKQSLQSYKTRFSNVRGVFAVKESKKNIIKDKRILIIDDILTTGATLSECAKVLKRSGAKSVISATVATTRR